MRFGPHERRSRETRNTASSPHPFLDRGFVAKTLVTQYRQLRRLQTARPTFWANGKPQNLGLVNFVPESRSPFVQISFSFDEKRPRSREHEFPFATFRPEKQDHLFNFPVTVREFSRGAPDKNMFHLHPNRNFRNFLVNRKRPEIPLNAKNFPLELPSKWCSNYRSDRIFQKLFVNGKQPSFSSSHWV